MSMTGAEHYAEAERLLERADEDTSEHLPPDVIAAATAHALLAVAYSQGVRPPRSGRSAGPMPAPGRP